MKKIFLVLLLVLLAGALFSQDITKYDAKFLVSMEVKDQELFMEGFLLGVYYAALVANWDYDLPRIDALRIMILDENPRRVLEDTLGWYVRTGAFDARMIVAIYRRKMDW